MLAEPILTNRHEQGFDLPVLLWRSHAPVLAVSSGPLGGGIGVRHWVVNATVPMSYDRDDPETHLAELADRLGLRGPGVGLLTGVDVADVVAAEEAGVRVWGTVGLSAPIRAAEPPTAAEPDAPIGTRAVPAGPAERAESVGTVNLVAVVPARLSEAALVNAVATVAEAKAQALTDLGLAATGTATDAVAIVCRPDGPVSRYGGPRSDWGAPLARVAHRVVLIGGAAAVVPWSDRHDRGGGSTGRSSCPS
jgi:adenosylcobinamide hydrolase